MTIAHSWAALSARERRVTTWAVGCVIVGVILGRGLPALNSWTSRERTRRVTLADSLASLREVLTWRQRSVTSRIAVSQHSSLQVLSLDSAPNRPAAEAKMMALVSAVGDDAGLDLTSLQIVAEPTSQRRTRIAPANALQRISVRTSGTGDIEALAAFLSFVDTSRVPVVVRSMTVSPRQQGPSNDGMNVLSIDFVVSALLRIPGYPPPERDR